MAIEIQAQSPLAIALTGTVQAKLEELGWVGADDNDLAEFIILMLVNGKADSEIATELGGLLSLSPEDATLQELAPWLYQQVNSLAATHSGIVGGNGPADETAVPASNGDSEMQVDSAGENGTINAPTGPKAMRDGTDSRGGRGKRMMNQVSRAMDRTTDSALHRVRGSSGTDRISRTPPAGPRMGVGRQPRAMNNRAATIAHGMANMNGANAINQGPQGMNGWPGMAAPGAPPIDMFSMMQQQQQMLEQMQQQLLMQQQGGGGSRGRGKSLFERAQNPNGRGGRGRGGHYQQNGRNPPSDAINTAAAGSGGDDMDMSGTKSEATEPAETLCKFNLRCTNKDCPFAHQSPAAPPGTAIDVTDVCTFGAACKNHKCVGRHPSPANKVAHQGEQECKFWPNCQNPRCPFKHPSKPPCRNGADCKTAGCDFTHTTVACRFNPCTNRYCTFKHADGQRGTFHDKVWTATDGAANGKEHVSERKFTDGEAPVEAILPNGNGMSVGGDEMVEGVVAG